ncbi:rare lipoprotein A [Sphingomonas guangdongensis]|uniref:Rare lipoprotein A n=1 Tax=Sphingomonas guangdongensis TaxID=1141890 RepID=A0A285R2A1_9SPHN|nr:SPOR domain-containing protein [Sphingomonas guangdongensis]SOB87849.1 rare lipoprotein A [Sphingomonas guangdongensis]
MKSPADLFALLIAASPAQGGVVAFQGVVGPQEPQAAGPRGSSEPIAGERRIDLVDRATVMSTPGVVVVAPGLAPGEIAEVTSLDSGRTILARVEAGTTLAISSEAAAALGLEGPRIPVRVRRTVAPPQEASALLRGEAAPARPDAPPALLTALRRRLAPPVETSPARAAPPRSRKRPGPVQPATAARSTAVPRSGPGVQVAALSDAARARALATELGGQVVSGGGLHRVQLGPFATPALAQAARATAARRGYPDARLITVVGQ